MGRPDRFSHARAHQHPDHQRRDDEPGKSKGCGHGCSPGRRLGQPACPARDQNKEQGKGGKDRYVPLAPDVLELLRAWWHVGGPRQWLFVAQSDAQQPLQPESAQRWYRAACAHAGITKRGGIHTLRHCWATHLLEAGVDLHSLSQWLGHSQVSTTTRYLHLISPHAPDGARSQPLALLSQLVPSSRQ